MKNILRTILFTCLLAWMNMSAGAQAKFVIKDSVVKRVTYRDTIIYRQVFKHDTVHVRHFVFSDTVRAEQPISIAASTSSRKKGLINPNNWGIGPSIGAYYSPYNGFDVNIGFGIQYYLLAVPSFRNPHLGHKRKK